jgi:DNA-binding SARP family transcriptional activator
MTAAADLRITILGEFEVRRPDGTVVGRDEWRTGKTMDLLRILALSNGRYVRRTTLAQRLWPNVSQDRARASLRTAGSQIRRATGTNCLVGQGDGILLEGAWVDAIVFLNDARHVHALARAGRHSRALDLTRAAERLYGGDFRAHEDESPWARAERDDLKRARKAMLCQAAESALAIDDFHHAAGFAETAVRIDPASEAARRALMLAYAELGEVGSALGVFEDLRAHLAEELGVDPSAQTKALHLRLLRGDTA